VKTLSFKIMSLISFGFYLYFQNARKYLIVDDDLIDYAVEEVVGTEENIKMESEDFTEPKLEVEEEDLSRLPPIKEAKFQCDMCSKMWRTKGELNAHKVTHNAARPFICEICGQVCIETFL